MFNTSHIKIAMDMEITDAGATGNFLLPVTQVKHLKPSGKTLTINLPHGTQLKSTHTCEINVPWIPKADRIAHIVPVMAHTSLVLIKVLTDVGCKFIYDKDGCRVYFNEKIVWDGEKEPTTGLYVLPINPIELNIQPRRHIRHHHNAEWLNQAPHGSQCIHYDEKIIPHQVPPPIYIHPHKENISERNLEQTIDNMDGTHSIRCAEAPTGIISRYQ